MPKLDEIVRALEKEYPFDLACSYDNVGLLVGRKDKEIKKVLISLDVTSAVIREARAIGADLILSHHPVIFREVKRITDESYTGGLLLELIEAGIAAVAVHTNFDAAPRGNNDALALKLGAGAYERIEDGFATAFDLAKEIPLAAFAEEVKSNLGDAVVRLIGEGTVSRVIAACGAGISEELIFRAKETDAVIVTADVKHNYASMARDFGVRLVETTHYGSEWATFTDRIVKYLTGVFEDLELVVGKENINPYDA